MSSQNAPPVLVPVGRFAVGQALAGLAALAVGALWLLAGAMLWPPEGLVLGLLCWGLLVGVTQAIMRRQAAASGQLQWTGQHWRWRTASPDDGFQAVELAVVADWQTGVLLRWRPAQISPGWATYGVLQASAMPLLWHGFRCALYCQAAQHQPAPQDGVSGAS